ncbi:SDR family oxidoreductase, partial [Clostridioides difficile]
EIAKLFAADNYPLLLLGRRQAKLAALSANFENAMIDTVDVTNYHQFETAVRKAEAKYGKTDLLVNNAGLMLLGNVQNQDPQEWQTMLNTNVMGVLNGTQI